jgi:hypothetical protein
MDIMLSVVLVGISLPIWLPLLLWYVADQDDKAAAQIVAA